MVFDNMSIVRRVIRYILMIILFLLLSPGGAQAQKGEIAGKPVNIEADVISYNHEEETYTASGTVHITFADMTLRADKVILEVQNNQATAWGNVVLTRSGDTLEGGKVVFNVAKGTGVVYDGKAFMATNHFFIRGKRIEKTGDRTYRGIDVTATTCDGDVPDWQLAGSELNVTVDGYATLKHGRFLIRGIPVFYVPYMIFPAKTTRQSGFLLPRIAYSQNIHGLDIKLPYYFALAENMDATLYLRYLEKSGLKTGLEYRYALSEKSTGTIYGDYLNDKRKITESLGDGLNRDWPGGAVRWSLYWNHETVFSATSYVRMDLFQVSDNWYFRDFHASNYYLDHYYPKGDKKFRRISFLANESLVSLDSHLRFVKKWDNFNFTARLRHTDDLSRPVNDFTLQKYPEITFTGVAQSLFGSPVRYELNSLYSYNYRIKGQRGHLADLNPVFSLSMALGRYLQFSPRLGLRATFWDRDDKLSGGREMKGARYSYNLGLNLATEFHRVFDLGSNGIEKIKHIVKPDITYSYAPYTEQKNLPDFAQAVSQQNSVTYGVTNALVAKVRDKKGNVSYRDYLRFRLSQTYDLREATREAASADERKPLSNVAMELDFSPYRNISFRARNSYNVYSGQFVQNNYDLSLFHDRGHSLVAGYRQTKDVLEELNLSLKAAVTRQLDLTYFLRRNLLTTKDVEKRMGINYRRQCWMFEFSYTNKEKDSLYMINITLFGLGVFGF